MLHLIAGVALLDSKCHKQKVAISQHRFVFRNSRRLGIEITNPMFFHNSQCHQKHVTGRCSFQGVVGSVDEKLAS